MKGRYLAVETYQRGLEGHAGMEPGTEDTGDADPDSGMVLEIRGTGFRQFFWRKGFLCAFRHCPPGISRYPGGVRGYGAGIPGASGVCKNKGKCELAAAQIPIPADHREVRVSGHLQGDSGLRGRGAEGAGYKDRAAERDDAGAGRQQVRV